MRDTQAKRASQEILTQLFGAPADRAFDIRYWDETVERAGHRAEAAFTLVLTRPCALRNMLLPPTERTLGEAYVRGDFEVEGDLEAATALAAAIRTRCRSPARFARILAGVRLLPEESAREPVVARVEGVTLARPGRRHSLSRDEESVRFHYDVGNDFYRLFLDRRMVYSCAYFRTDENDLDAAQEEKLEHICRKLNLRPGERLLDIGCGWGSLVEFAARRFGVEAVGITLSPRQAELARQRIAASGLSERCCIHIQDYRSLPGDARFDKIASVGMVEHVGQMKLRQYFDVAFRHLEPGGLFLNHGIVSLEPEPARIVPRVVARAFRRWSSFIERHVFPDGELLAPSALLAPAHASGFELRDVENLREHYVLTLRHWVQRLEANVAEAVEYAGEHIWRTWRLYMAASAHAFATGRIGVLQVLLARPQPDGRVPLPLTREHLYPAETRYATSWHSGLHAATGAARREETCDVAH